MCFRILPLLKYLFICNSANYTNYVNILINTSNSMCSSEIWNKYHNYCIENSEVKPTKISIFNATRLVLIPNFTCYS